MIRAFKAVMRLFACDTPCNLEDDSHYRVHNPIHLLMWPAAGLVIGTVVALLYQVATQTYHESSLYSIAVVDLAGFVSLICTYISAKVCSFWH